MNLNGAINVKTDSNDFSLHQDSQGRLVLNIAGREYVGVNPVRAFPFTDPSHGVAICGAEGHEFIWIEDLQSLSAPIRRVLEEQLAQREFVPVVRRILAVSAAVEPSEWEVETDRGRTKFQLNNENDIHRLKEHGALLTDSHGIRYLIPDVRILDSASRILLERYL
ncbi:MAG: DUF1854 domain-containing protein [Gemmataceae bacterium]